MAESSKRAPLDAVGISRHSAARLMLASLVALGAGCSAPATSDSLGVPMPTAASGAPAAAAAGSGNGTTGDILARPRCQVPPGATGSPRTIEEAVQLLNALPKPTSVACFVESLDRPLTAFATNSVFSAQPALNTKSPRVFLRFDNLWVSIVIDGESSFLIEFGYLLPGEQLQSIKGELLLPLETAIEPSAPYDRVLYQEGTVCGLCHFGERRVDSIGFASAFASEAFRPRPETRVSLEPLRLDAQSCDFQAEPARCEMLSAVFGGGPVIEAAFPDSMVTFF